VGRLLRRRAQLLELHRNGLRHRGKGFFVVELATGNVLWSYTLADNSDLAYAMPGTPTTIDSDNDGFIDAAYIGDMGGNLWRFKFCFAADGSSCSTSNWSGSRLFARHDGIGPVYDARRHPGHQRQYLALLGHGRQGRAHRRGHYHGSALRREDKTLSGTLQLSSLETSRAAPTPTTPQERLVHQPLGTGEKCLSDPSIFGARSTSRPIPREHRQRPLQPGGTAKLYAVNYLSGAGSLTAAAGA